MVKDKKKPGRPNLYNYKPVKFNLSFDPELKKMVEDEASKKNVKPNKIVMDAVKLYFNKHLKINKKSGIENIVWSIYEIFVEAKVETGFIDENLLLKIKNHCNNIQTLKNPKTKRLEAKNLYNLIYGILFMDDFNGYPKLLNELREYMEKE